MGVVRRDELQSRLLLPLDSPHSIVITPLLDPAHAFDSDSVDVRLGQTFLLSKTLQQPFFCPDKLSRDTLYVEVFVPLGRYLIVPAHQTVLGSTLEFIKVPSDLSGEILTKSSVARTFIVIETAPWVHPDYRGCLTLEIANVSNTPVLLYPGRKIGQLIFMHLDPNAIDSKTSLPPASNRKLNPTYYGPVYPEGPKFSDPDEDLSEIGVRRTWKIIEKPPSNIEKNEPPQANIIEELREVIRRGFKSSAVGNAPLIPEYHLEAVFDAVVISPPEYEAEDEASRALVEIELREPNVTFGSGDTSRASSQKLRNIRLSIGSFMRVGPSAYKAIHDHSTLAILQVACGLYELSTSIRRVLNVTEAIVFRAMWELGGGDRALSELEILERSRKDYSEQGLGDLSERDLELALEKLSDTKCIHLEGVGHPRLWRTAEQIEYSYRR